MSTLPNTIPCGQLAVPALVARVGSTMDTSGMAHPPYALRAGFCRFCAHPLPYAFSAMRWVDGAIKRIDWKEGEAPAGLKFNEAGAVNLGQGAMLVHRVGEQAMESTGLRPMSAMIPTVLLCVNGACAALTEAIFNQASAVARERAQRIATQQAVKGNAKELAAKNAARSAARTLAGSIERGMVGPST